MSFHYSKHLERKLILVVDPESPQADELRHLLNVVSGRAPDKHGKVSEPLVKEELAIVEFLTAKSTAPGKSKSSRTSDQPGDQTPVDLLLNLAKTRSGRRAAEEEKRQLRLQQYREVEEQRRATSSKGGKDGMASPWGYQAPQMPGLDVQQPFAANGSRKVPRPLAPPSRRNESQPSNDPWNFSNFTMDSSITQPNFQMTRPTSASFGAAPAANAQAQQIQQQHQQQQLQTSPHQDLNPLQFPSVSSTSPFGQLSMPGQQNQPSLSPDNMFGLPDTNPSDLGQGNGQMDSMQLFGNALMDQFDFSDLGLGNGVQNDNVESSFNPFALAQAQTEDG